MINLTYCAAKKLLIVVLNFVLGLLFDTIIKH